ncbi:MAG TPA: AAA family ATPase [Candidatus Binatia bacterium]|nr:AAA family ATPase [Candidatus Binatia bacterium]
MREGRTGHRAPAMADSNRTAGVWTFGDLVLDAGRRELLRCGRPLAIEPKVFDLLAYLVRFRHRVVGRDELLDALWPGEHVSDDALSYSVKAARRAVGDTGARQRTIATVRRRGFRFVADAVEPPARNDAAAVFPAVATASPGGARTGFFVGREPVVARLAGALSAARAGRGRIALLAGEPGIGKTRTAEELARIAREQGCDVFVGRCHESAGAPPFEPWVQILRGYVESRHRADVLTTIGSASFDLVALVPELSGAGGSPSAEAGSDREDARFRLFATASAFLRAAAGRCPLLLVLDDLHWADAPSLLLLSFVARHVAGARLLLVGTFRDTDVGGDHPLATCIAEIARLDGADRIDLHGLTPDDLARFLEATTGSSPPAALVRAIHEQTGGNPFFATEAVRLLLAEGGELGDTRVPVPRTVREAIAARIEKLSSGARRLLCAAAVVGREFDVDVLARVRDGGRPRPRGDVQSGLCEAESARLIEARESPGGFRFAHALVRETLYASLAAEERSRLHAAVGRAMAAAHGPDRGPELAALAHHFAGSTSPGDRRRALEYAIAAGDRAARMLAYEEAAGHYGRAVDLLEHGRAALRGRQSRRDAIDELRFRLGENLWKSGEFDQAKDAFRRAAESAREARSATRLARAALGFGGGFRGFDFGVVDPELIGLLEEASLALPPRASGLRARVLARLAVALYSVPGSLGRRQKLGSEAVRMAERSGDTASQLAALYGRHWTLWGPDTLRERLATARAMLRLAVRTGDRESALHAHRFHLIDSLELGAIDDVDSHLADFVRLADDLRQPYYHWFAAQMRSMRALVDGRVADADRLAEEALAAGRTARSRNVEPVYWTQMLWIRREQGRLDEVEPVFRMGVEHFPALPAWRCALALVQSELGRTAEAALHLDVLSVDDFATVPRNAFWMASMIGIADVAADLRDADRAAVAYRLLAPHAGRVVEASVGASCLGSVDRALGRMAGLLGRRGEAARHFADALAIERRLAAPLLVARTERARAAALEGGRRESAGRRARHRARRPGRSAAC